MSGKKSGKKGSYYDESDFSQYDDYMQEEPWFSGYSAHSYVYDGEASAPKSELFTLGSPAPSISQGPSIDPPVKQSFQLGAKFNADSAVVTPKEHSTVFNFPASSDNAATAASATSSARPLGPILKKSIFMTMATMSMAFSYPATDMGFGTMHVVRGEDRLGLLVDTGASSALMGTDTLRKHLEHIVEPMGAMDAVTYGPSNATFTGVGGKPEKGLGVCTLPLGVPGLPGATFQTDLIGNEGSACPGLMPLPSMVDCSGTVVCNVYDNHDGILIISAPGKRKRDRPLVALVRLLYTDSNHYLMPTDKIHQTAREIAVEQAEVWSSLKKHW